MQTRKLDYRQKQNKKLYNKLTCEEAIEKDLWFHKTSRNLNCLMIDDDKDSQQPQMFQCKSSKNQNL